MNEYELYHYGVVGMKWGVRRASRKQSSNEKLRRKAEGYDAKSASYTRASERAHSKNDLGVANKAADKSAKYAVKAANYRRKALNTDSEIRRDRYTTKSAKLEYKSATKKREANALSKLSGYGKEAMKLSVKSDKFAAKAAKARMKVANNERYINTMNRKVSSLSVEEQAAAKAWLKS